MAEKLSVEHSFCAKQCVMLMEKSALKERCWLFVAVNSAHNTSNLLISKLLVLCAEY